MGTRAYSGGGRHGGQAFRGSNNVRPFRGGGGQAHRFHNGGHRHVHRSHRRHRHAHRGRYLLYGAPIAAYGYYAYGDGCEWLRQRALYTGSTYWWDRYNACASGYDYN